MGSMPPFTKTMQAMAANRIGVITRIEVKRKSGERITLQIFMPVPPFRCSFEFFCLFDDEFLLISAEDRGGGDQKNHDCLNDVYNLKRDIGISGHDIRADPQVR